MCLLALLVRRFNGSSDTTDMSLAAESVRSTVLDAHGQVRVRGWDAYRVAQYAARTGFYALAADIYDALSLKVSWRGKSCVICSVVI